MIFIAFMLISNTTLSNRIASIEKLFDAYAYLFNKGNINIILSSFHISHLLIFQKFEF